MNADLFVGNAGTAARSLVAWRWLHSRKQTIALMALPRRESGQSAIWSMRYARLAPQSTTPAISAGPMAVARLPLSGRFRIRGDAIAVFDRFVDGAADGPARTGSRAIISVGGEA